MSQRPLLVVSEAAQASMTASAALAHPNETGGILIGVRLDGHPWVTTAVEIASVDIGRRRYRLPAGTTQPAVHAAREADPRVGYLGDWHSHPEDVGPSRTDLVTLGLISINHSEDPNPTLIVVRNASDGYVLDARRIVAFTARACELRLAGSLAPLAT